MSEEAQGPWSGHKLYKIFHPKEGRWYVRLIAPNSEKTTAFARYLMEVHLNRKLDTLETVDHVNGNKEDDRIENLQIMSFGDNIRKSAKPALKVNLICDFCKLEFERSKRQTGKYKSNRNFCTKKCAYAYFSEHKVCVTKNKKEITHGTKTAYSYHKCRCKICKEFNAQLARERRAKN